MTSNLCSAFGVCASCLLCGDANEQKDLKISSTKEKFQEFFDDEITFYACDNIHFRTRAELRIWHNDNKIYYAMHDANNNVVCIDNCIILDKKIYALMPKLLNKINENFKLKEKIFACEFVSSSDEICVILLYHKDIFEIKDQLQILSDELNINIIARSRGKKIVCKNEFLIDKIQVNSRQLKYKISPDCFIQPNSSANKNMLNFVFSELLKQQNRRDLCELYCGHGNFTLALSSLFNNIVATEISKLSINLAKENARLNDINNINFLRLSADEFTKAIKQNKTFRRLENLDINKFDFSHILVDPPRAGCDEIVLDLMKNFDNIIYISCNQTTLLRDLEILVKTHKIINLALFDQFAHTKHIETICLLKKI